ncbi:hypothetical protein E8E13_007789 [Curvularia kusanoi]|uniref:Uncharacterized protein n=1 Tax=Curvularia kusanoi TaxID=90978 RepID=A0A9P4WEA0_CURKU|nr:hypothetical protein E8E13_007789 [Curvularia kusanoi]
MLVDFSKCREDKSLATDAARDEKQFQEHEFYTSPPGPNPTLLVFRMATLPAATSAVRPPTIAARRGQSPLSSIDLDLANKTSIEPPCRRSEDFVRVATRRGHVQLAPLDIEIANNTLWLN